MGDPVEELKRGFDVVVMGTGITETILSGIMSKEGKRVLHIDSNSYYGGDGASLKMSSVFQKFRGKDAQPPPGLDKDRDWNIDLIPKFLMAGGEVARILRNLKQVQDNVQFQQISGSYVYRAKKPSLIPGMSGGPGIAKVPSTATEATTSSLIGLMEKNRLRNFLQSVADFDDTKGPLHQGSNLDTVTMKSIYEKFNLDPHTQEFVGHAMALYSDDGYLNLPARATFNKIRLYASSVAMYGKSPYIYPLYGLGELPSAFTRLSAVHGGTYMLNTAINRDAGVDGFEFTDGKVSGVNIKFENPNDGSPVSLLVNTPRVLAAPDYVPEGKKKRKTGQQVIRAICILNHPVKDADESCQIILPPDQIGRKNDIYIAVLSSAHFVCPRDYYIAIVSTIAEKPYNHQEELKVAFELLGPIEETFMAAPSVLWEQTDDSGDNIFVSKSLDATSHLETCTDDVKDLYKRMEGKDLDIDSLDTSRPAED